MRDRALHLMRTGLASPGEIARAIGVSRLLVMNWRARAGIDSATARIARVRRLMMTGNGHGKVEHTNGSAAQERETCGHQAIVAAPMRGSRLPVLYCGWCGDRDPLIEHLRH